MPIMCTCCTVAMLRDRLKLPLQLQDDVFNENTISTIGIDFVGNLTFWGPEQSRGGYQAAELGRKQQQHSMKGCTYLAYACLSEGQVRLYSRRQYTEARRMSSSEAQGRLASSHSG